MLKQVQESMSQVIIFHNSTNIVTLWLYCLIILDSIELTYKDLIFVFLNATNYA